MIITAGNPRTNLKSYKTYEQSIHTRNVVLKKRKKKETGK